MRIHIENFQPLTLNQLMKIHWGSRTKRKMSDYAMIAAYSRHIPKATQKRRVEMTIQLAPRQRASDVDAFWKVALDGLVKCGMLVDDSPKWCEIMPIKFTRDRLKATTIVLTDID